MVCVRDYDFDVGRGDGGALACMDFKYTGAVKRIGDRALRIMIVGERILPFRHAGDKNFWLDMIRRLLVAGHEVEALSRSEERRVGKECRARWCRAESKAR